MNIECHLKREDIKSYTKGIAGYLLQYFVSLDKDRFVYEVDYFPNMIKDHVKWYLLHQHWYCKKMLLYGFIRRIYNILIDYGSTTISPDIIDILKLYHDTPTFDTYDDILDISMDEYPQS